MWAFQSNQCISPCVNPTLLLSVFPNAFSPPTTGHHHSFLLLMLGTRSPRATFFSPELHHATLTCLVGTPCLCFNCWNYILEWSHVILVELLHDRMRYPHLSTLKKLAPELRTWDMSVKKIWKYGRFIFLERSNSFSSSFVQDISSIQQSPYTISWIWYYLFS